MKIESGMTDRFLMKVLGQRLAAQRLARNLTQQQVAEEAGLGLRTVQRLEQGACAIQLTGFLRVIRVLGLIERMEVWLPEVEPGPIERLKMAGKARQRASGKQTIQAPKRPWTWGKS